jgi:ribonuclease P protein component
MGTAGLRPSERVRQRAEFDRIYKQGLKVHGRFMTMFLLQSDRDLCRIGIAATRKLGNAVVRNRAKRLSRELFRRHKPRPGLDIVVVPRREFLAAEFSNLERDYRALVSVRRERVPRVQPPPPGA